MLNTELEWLMRLPKCKTAMQAAKAVLVDFNVLALWILHVASNDRYTFPTSEHLEAQAWLVSGNC